MIAAALLAAALAAASPPPAPHRVVVFYPEWVQDGFPPEAIPWAQVTHVAHCFLPFGPDGKIGPTRTIPSHELTTQAHAAGKRAILVLGGEDSGSLFTAVCGNRRSLNVFVGSVIGAVMNAGYDGVELDWEFPASEADAKAFDGLAFLLRSRLARLGAVGRMHYTLSVALPMGADAGRWFDALRLAQATDFFDLMTYDNAGPWRDLAAPNDPLGPVAGDPDAGTIEAAVRYWTQERKLPPERLNLGLAFYGRGAPVREPYARVPKASVTSWTEPDFKDVPPLLAAGWTRSWDGDAAQPWLRAPDGSAVITYDDAESIAVRTKWARDHGLGGVFVWHLGSDLTAPLAHPLLDAATAAWPQP